MKLTVEIDTDDLEASDLSVIEFIYKHQKKRLRGACVALGPSNGQPPGEGIADEQPRKNGLPTSSLLREVSRLRNTG